MDADNDIGNVDIGDLWPRHAGQKLFQDSPDQDNAPIYVFCVLCGEPFDLVDGDSYMTYSNGAEVYLVHDSCGLGMNAVRSSLEEKAKKQDERYDH